MSNQAHIVPYYRLQDEDRPLAGMATAEQVAIHPDVHSDTAHVTSFRYEIDRPGMLTVELRGIGGESLCRNSGIKTEAGWYRMHLHTYDLPPGTYLMILCFETASTQIQLQKQIRIISNHS